MKKVKVSVIMGIYNCRSKEILAKSINSILNQTYRDFELIICDDGSSNECFEWAREICKDDNRVIFVKNDENMGLSHALNKCLKEANGEYIARMDDDDCAHLDRFEKQVEFLDSHPEIGLVSSSVNLFDDERGIWGKIRYPEYIKAKDFLYTSPVIHPAVMARKSAYDAVQGYNESKKVLRSEDYYCFMQIYAKGIKIYNFQEPLLDYREDKNSGKRRKYKYRFNEMYVRYHGFKELKILNLKNYAFVIKPLIAGLIPQGILRRLKKK